MFFSNYMYLFNWSQWNRIFSIQESDQFSRLLTHSTQHLLHIHYMYASHLCMNLSKSSKAQYRKMVLAISTIFWKQTHVHIQYQSLRAYYKSGNWSWLDSVNDWPLMGNLPCWAFNSWILLHERTPWPSNYYN